MTDSINPLPDRAPFDPAQTAAINALIPSLSAPQAAWLGGYLTGLGQVAGQGSTALVPAGSAPSVPIFPLTILYGSESGNAEGCAHQLVRVAEETGFKAAAIDMSVYESSHLAREKNVLIVVSTWGEGDPPEPAIEFHSFVMGDKAPSLNGLNYAVFALGDTSYAEFCACGKQFDARFADLGAHRICDRVEADVDFEKPFADWMKTVMPRMAKAAGVGDASPAPSIEVRAEQAPTSVPAPTEILYGKKNPFPAPVKSLINLNGRTSAKRTCHIEFSLEGSGLDYLPGDVVGIIPKNDPSVVEGVIRAAGFRNDEAVEDEQGTRSLAEILESGYDVTGLNVSLMKKYAALAGNSDLDALLGDDNKEKIKDWVWGREIEDLLLAYPSKSSYGVDQLLGMLRKMPPRLYSIASSLRAHPQEVHLTVGAVYYNTHGRDRKGVCSTYLCDRIGEGDQVMLYTHHNKNFSLPENGETPIIMIGPGTGIAPFRAFVEERAALGDKGKNWLFFGDQHFNSDFLYQLEWQDYLKRGVLTRLAVAFSRDTDHKVYVQHRMKEAARDIYAWMKEGAFFYVCGDANRMAKDVHQALIEIYAEQGDMGIDAAETAVKELQKSKRYQRDVY